MIRSSGGGTNPCVKLTKIREVCYSENIIICYCSPDDECPPFTGLDVSNFSVENVSLNHGAQNSVLLWGNDSAAKCGLGWEIPVYVSRQRYRENIGLDHLSHPMGWCVASIDKHRLALKSQVSLPILIDGGTYYDGNVGAHLHLPKSPLGAGHFCDRGHIGCGASGKSFNGVSRTSRLFHRSGHMTGMLISSVDRSSELSELPFSRLPETFSGIPQNIGEDRYQNCRESRNWPLVFISEIASTDNARGQSYNRAADNGATLLKGGFGILIILLAHAILKRR